MKMKIILMRPVNVVDFEGADDIEEAVYDIIDENLKRHSKRSNKMKPPIRHSACKAIIGSYTKTIDTSTLFIYWITNGHSRLTAMLLEKSIVN